MKKTTNTTAIVPTGYFDLGGEPMLEKLIKNHKAACHPADFGKKTEFLKYVKSLMFSFKVSLSLDRYAPESAFVEERRTVDDVGERSASSRFTERCLRQTGW